jgi:hypothetical protein
MRPQADNHNILRNAYFRAAKIEDQSNGDCSTKTEMECPFRRPLVAKPAARKFKAL